MTKEFTELESFTVVMGLFGGLLLIAYGLNSIIPHENINPYFIMVLGAIIVIITSACALKKNTK